MGTSNETRGIQNAGTSEFHTPLGVRDRYLQAQEGLVNIQRGVAALEAYNTISDLRTSHIQKQKQLIMNAHNEAGEGERESMFRKYGKQLVRHGIEKGKQKAIGTAKRLLVTRLSGFSIGIIVQILVISYLVQFAFAVIAAIGYALKGSVLDLKDAGFFGWVAGTIAGVIPFEEIGGFAWMVCICITIAVFICFSVFFFLISINPYKGAISFLITAVCLFLNLALITNMFPFIQMWVIYMLFPFRPK